MSKNLGSKKRQKQLRPQNSTKKTNKKKKIKIYTEVKKLFSPPNNFTYRKKDKISLFQPSQKGAKKKNK